MPIKERSDRETKEHPAYGLVRLSRLHGGVEPLVGASIQHRNCISLIIKEAVKYRDGFSEGFMVKREVCEILMSYPQFTELILSNDPEIPCTIRYVLGDETRRPAPESESSLKDATDELRDTVRGILDNARQLAREAQGLIDKGLSRKEDRERLQDLVGRIETDINSNIAHVSSRVDQKVEESIRHAKAEIDAYLGDKLNELGLEAVKGSIVSLPFPECREEGKGE